MENKARKEANTAMKEARARLEVNYADALSIPKEAYELEREAMLVQGAQALEAGIESERGGAATAGRVLASQQQAQAGARTAMATDIFDLEAMKAEERFKTTRHKRADGHRRGYGGTTKRGRRTGCCYGSKESGH
jgi:hypothetical protein